MLSAPPPQSRLSFSHLFGTMPRSRKDGNIQVVASPSPITNPDQTPAPAAYIKPEDVMPALPTTKQPYDAFLVLDVEATCYNGSGFDWPSEIIEWPVCLMQWKDKTLKGKASKLEVIEEFRSFVKPQWQPELTPFCTQLTGITQSQVVQAPTFPEVMKQFEAFLVKHGLIDQETGERLVHFVWCTDGPYDVRDFVIKQCFISNISLPEWLRGDVLDVRKIVTNLNESRWTQNKPTRKNKAPAFPRRPSLNIPSQLRSLGLSSFEGRQHSGIDDTRNIARILAELARRNIRLEPNTHINARRRWPWMGKSGEILEDRVYSRSY